MLELDSTSSKLDLAVLELDSVMEVLDSEAPDFYKVFLMLGSPDCPTLKGEGVNMVANSLPNLGLKLLA